MEKKDLWLVSLQSQMDYFHRKNTWTLLHRSEARNPLSSKWMFKRKALINQDDVTPSSTGHLLSLGVSNKHLVSTTMKRTLL